MIDAVRQNLSNEDLEKAIELLREDLVEFGLTKGLNNYKTIELSKKLDAYLAEYQNRTRSIKKYSQQRSKS